MASMLLMHAGIAQAQTSSPYKPTKRGGGGALKLLWWQGATLLNPHFAGGTKDQDGSRIFYEPLAGWDSDGNLVADAGRRDSDARERRRVGRRQDGHLEAQARRHLARRQAVHRRRRACSPGSTPATRRPPPSPSAVYKDIKVEKVDSHTVRVEFPKPTPFWAEPFVGSRGHDPAQARVRAPYIGAKSREAPANLKPVGTGPVQVRRLQAGRHGARRAQPQLPRAQPAVLRRDRNEGRRRRGVRRARGAADRRVRLRLEPAGRGRDPQAPGGRRQGQGQHRPRRQHRVHPAQRHRPVDRGRRRARAASRPSTRPSATRRCARRWRCWSTARACRSSSTAAPASRPPTS